MNWIFKKRMAYLLFDFLATACAATAQQRPLQTANSCPLTEPIIDEPPKDPNASSFGRGSGM